MSVVPETGVGASPRLFCLAVSPFLLLVYLGQTQSTFNDVAEGVLSARSSLRSIRAAYTVSYSDVDKVRTVEKDPEGHIHIHWHGIPAGTYTWAWSRDAEPSARNPYTSDKRLLERRQEEGDLTEMRAWAFNGSVSTSLLVRERGHPNGWISSGVDFQAFVTNEVVSDFALYCYQETWETVIAHDWLRLAGTDTVDGRTCYVLQGRVSRNPDADFPGYPVKLWIDPARGFACVKREVRDLATGDIIEGQSYEVLELKQVGTGLWMPTHVAYGNGADIRLTAVTVNDPVPDGVFTLSFPEGTVVTDKVLGIRYRIGREGVLLDGETPSTAPLLTEEALDAMLTEAESLPIGNEVAGPMDAATETVPAVAIVEQVHEPSSPRWWLFAPAAALLAVGLAYLIHAMRRATHS